MPKSEFHRLALFGGSFDPIHHGHINSAKHIAKWLNVDSITLIPNFISPHKNHSHVSSRHRANMVELVCLQEPLFTMDTRELNKQSSSYTVDTLKEIKQANSNSTLFFVIGMDSLQTFTTWHCWQEILNLAHLVVCTRPGYLLSDNNQATQKLLDKYQTCSLDKSQEKPSGSIIFSSENNTDISSTEIRDRLKTPNKVQKLLPDNVLDYINRYKLYR